MLKVGCIIVILLVLWTILQYYFADKFVWKSFNALVLPITIFIILYFIVLGRSTSGQQVLIIANNNSREFTREMVMNAVLFLPFGLILCTLMRPWSVFEGLVLSVAIEYIQHYYGMGIAQATDVLMNTLGSAIGALPFIFVKIIKLKMKSPKY